MLFPTLDFGIFFLVVFFVGWALKDRVELRKYFLVVASYYFYGFWDWRFCFLLAGSSLANYVAGVLIESQTSERARRLTVAAAVIANIGTLAFFKYFDFFIGSLNDALYDLGLEREIPYMGIILPVGISFFTFQGISYVVDVYRRDIKASFSVVDIFLYISFFPQLVAGPIVRASTMMPQVTRPAAPDRILMTWGTLLVLLGLFKKLVVANYLATELVDIAFFDPEFYGTFDLLMAIYGYTVQIYMDFSGYSDIAIGVAATLGFRFDKNFDQPLRSGSIREFWRRWHLSLSTWLRDYLYIPLGGSRASRWRARWNLFLTMFLGGIWHGAAWHYIVWGTMHGLALMVENMVTHGRQLTRKSLLMQAVAFLYAWHFLCLTFIVFRAESLEYAWIYIRSFANWDIPTELATPFLVALAAGGLFAQFLPGDLLERATRRLARLPAVVQGGLACAAIVAIDAMGPDGVAPFIYFQF